MIDVRPWESDHLCQHCEENPRQYRVLLGRLTRFVCETCLINALLDVVPSAHDYDQED